MLEGQKSLHGADFSVIGGSPYVGWTELFENLDYSGYSTKETGNVPFQILGFHVPNKIKILFNWFELSFRKSYIYII